MASGSMQSMNAQPGLATTHPKIPYYRTIPQRLRRAEPYRRSRPLPISYLSQTAQRGQASRWRYCCQAVPDAVPSGSGHDSATKRGLLQQIWLQILDWFPPLGSPEVVRRAAVTLGIIALVRLGSFVPLYGIDQAQVQQSPTTLAALQIGAQVTPSVAVDVFNLGISPMFVGGMYVTIVRLIPQQLLPWQRKNGEEGMMDDKLAEKGVAAAAAVFLAIVRAFQLKKHCIPGVARYWASSILTLAAGAVLLHFLADTNEAAGLGIGAGLLVAVSLLQRQALLVSEALKKLRSGALSLLPTCVAITAVVGLVAAAITVSLVEKRLEMVSTKIGAAQGGMSHRRRRSERSNLPIRITPTGVSSLILSSVYLSMFLGTLAVVGGRLGASIAAILTSPLIMPLLVGFVSFASVFINPAGAKLTLDLSVMMQNIGAGIKCQPPLPPGAPTRRFLARQLRLANFWGGVVVALLGCTAYSLDLVCQLAMGSNFGAVNMLLLTGFVTTTYRQVSALSELPKLGRRIEKEQELLQSYAG